MSIEQRMEEITQTSAQTRASMADVETKFEAAFSGAVDEQQIMDLENITLPEVRKQNDQMSSNIAELLMGLDDTTNSFQNRFKELEVASTSERLIGMIFPKKASAMRQERIRNASIDDNLSRLLTQGQAIDKVMVEHLSVIKGQQEKIETNLLKTLDQRIETLKKMDQVKSDLDTMSPVLANLDEELRAATTPTERSRIESEISKMNSEYNQLLNDERVLLAESQTLERYISAGQTWQKSLEDQASTQAVLINKLRIDTEQRVVLYDALVKSMKTAQQQEVAHTYNNLGVETDQLALKGMAGIGAASNNHLAGMLERHEGDMVHSRRIMEEKARADERFSRRFGDVQRKHDAAEYGA